MTWDELEYWRSPEWRIIQEKLDDLDQRGVILCPRRENLFAALDCVDLEQVRVVIMGQDPYPDIVDATGIAFSIPPGIRELPYTLGIIMREYQNDLHYSIPTSGDLTRWAKEGVLLWNAIPSTEQGKSLAHYGWREWQPLTTELVQVLDRQGVVFAFLGSIARDYAQFAQSGNSKVIQLAHPAAERYGRGKSKRNLFSDSRFFTTINDNLVSLGKTPINWKL